MAVENSPLTDLHLEAIKNQLAVIDKAEAQIALAKQAGIDVSEAETKLRTGKEQLLRIKNTYFAGQ